MNHLYQQELVNFLCKVPDSNILACLGPLDSEGTTQACHFSMIVVIDFIHTHTHTHTHTHYTWIEKYFVLIKLFA